MRVGRHGITLIARRSCTLPLSSRRYTTSPSPAPALPITYTYPELDPPPSQRDQTLTLSSGHTVGYAQLGSPTGYPLIFLHGFPSCRLEPWSLHKMLQRKGIRLIAPDRPGYGLSTFQPGRRIIDYPSDVLALADRLELREFALLGASGGGPYALACASELMNERGRMKAVGLLAAMGPWAVPGQGGRLGGKGRKQENGDEVETLEKELMRDVRTSSWLLGRAIQTMPRTMERVAEVWLSVARWMLSRPKWQRGLDKWLSDIDAKYARLPGVQIHPEDTFPTPIARAHVLALFHNIFAQGTSGMIHDSLLLTNDWGFDLPDIKYDKVQIWHGTGDVNAPINAMRYVARQIPHVEMKEYDADHYEMGAYVGQVLDELVTEDMKRRYRERRGGSGME